ncbi:TPA: hypothetical protein DF272_03890 [Candidatus Falkowbacteria bacterium]|nr:hypothetical protein [Candidatus Falkowbacteria bacterium]
MNKKLIGAGLLVLVAVVAMLVWKFTKPVLDEAEVVETSDAKDVEGKITIALDNWVGYFPFRSKEFKKRMRQAGWEVKVIDDAADYHARMKQLNDGEIDFAVVTVDSYILNAAKHNYPGVVVTVIDESNGGDAVVALEKAGKSLDDFRGKSVRVAFTPDSPSHYLLKALKSHFNLNELLPSGLTGMRIETKGSEEALQKLLSGQADVAVLWEPDVSRALEQPGVVKIFSTKETERYVVDILVVSRDFLKKNPKEVKLFLSNYFRALKWYRDNEEEWFKELEAETKSDRKRVRDMVDGVDWPSMSQNCTKWFGISAPGEDSNEVLVEVIESTVNVLIDNDDFKASPLPDEDPYKIIYSGVLQDLYAGYSGVKTPTTVAEAMLTQGMKFEPLAAENWAKLQPVGTLKIQPIVFQSGTFQLSTEGKEELDKLMQKLKHFPQYRIKVVGHTSNEGDPTANKQLSQERAESVVQYLNVTHNVDFNRCLAHGLGGEQPLIREAGQSYRDWQYGLPRVEIVLVREDL